MTFDAIILADATTAEWRVAGLTLVERARRVAIRVGAARVLVVRDDGDRARVADWWRETPSGGLLVIRGGDQMVHVPLVAPLVAAGTSARAVGDDGAFAGAVIARDAASVDAAIAAIASGDDPSTIARAAPAIAHGSVARHPVRDEAERRAAERLLHTILVKPQDNAITRYLYRPVSMPLSKLLVRTPITPNQISYVVAVLVGIGLWVTAHAELSWAFAGSAILLFASYIDCCDGEIARLKLMSSRFGAWLDTVVDELSSVGYMIAIGWHCHLHYGADYFGAVSASPWLVAIAISIATYLWSLYCIYYNIIVVVGSANSQDYVGRFEVVPGDAPGTVRLRPAATKAITVDDQPKWIQWVATYLPHVIRRDFISWGTLVLAAFGLTHVVFGMLALGGLVTMAIVTVDHVRLIRQRRAIARKGQVLVLTRAA
jgi:phosphatidylglycerophosphate synthase